MKPLRIAYLLEDTDLAGGIRVAVAQADSLIARGHEVVLVNRGGELTWRTSRARWRHVDRFEDFDPAGFDFVVGTFWKTIASTLAVAGERAVHLCQGYEGSFTAYRDLRDAIEAAYRLPIPKITVSQHLVEICRRFHDDATYIGQIVDDDFFQPHASASRRPRVLLAGPWQADFKGVDVGYAAVRRALELGADFDLIRVSQWPPASDEPARLAGEFHVALPTPAMARLFASSDIFLGPSRSQEGFGLPAAEAMASGVPVILTRIPSFSSWSSAQDHALFVDENDGRAMGEALASLLRDEPLRRRLAERGREVAEEFRAARTGARLEAWFDARRRAAML
jgi:glycosyltransferase involved in cell wall biosynthesis